MDLIDYPNAYSGLSDAENRRIIILKYLNYAGISIHLFTSAVYSIMDFRTFYPQIINILFFISPFLISLRLIAREKYNAAKITTVFIASWPIIIGSVCFLGKDAGLQYNLIIYALLPLLIWRFDEKYYSIPIFLLNILSFCFIEFSDIDKYSVTKIPSRYVEFHVLITYIIDFLFIGSLLIYYQIISERFETTLNGKSTSLKKINLQLIEQKEVMTKANTLLEERQKQIEEQSETLFKMNEELEEIVTTKDKFFSIIAHDLKNPLGTLMEFSKILYKDHAQYDDNQRSEISKIIYENSISTFNLLDNLLIWSKMQISGIKTNPERVNIYDLIIETNRLLENTRTNKIIALDLPSDTNLEVSADRYMLSSVLNNLLSNAIKYTPEGGIISISTDLVDDAYVKVCISDNGMGISKENISRLFRIDQSFSTPGTNNEKGTGLGLLLCKEFVEKNGGKIWAESEPGKGSQFYFTVRII